MNPVGYYTQSSDVQQIHALEEEFVGGWNLNGKDIQLIRLGDQLQIKTVYPSGATDIEPVELTEVLSSCSMEQMLEYLLSMKVSEDADGSVELEQTDESIRISCGIRALNKPVSNIGATPLDQEEIPEIVVKTWNIDNRDVRLVRLGDQLQAKIIYPFGQPVFSNVKFPATLTIDQAIQQICDKMFPVIVEDRRVDFIRIPENVDVEPEEEYEYKEAERHISRLDGRSEITNDIWAITLADTVACQKIGTDNRKNRNQCFNPIINEMHNTSTWGGHAVVFIESVKNDIHGISYGHLTLDGIKLNKIINEFDSSAISSKSVTWLRPRNIVQRMIEKIEWQIREQEIGRPPVVLDRRGHGSIGVSSDESVMNCYDYACSILKLAGVNLRKEKNVLERVGIPPIAVLPKRHISSSSLSSKEPILVKIDVELFQTAGFFSKTYHDKIGKTLNLSWDLDRALGGKPWRIASNSGNPIDSNGVLATVKTKIRVDRQDKGYSLEFKVDKVIIPLEIDDELHKCDITDIVRSRIEDLIKTEYVKNVCSVM